MKKKNETGIILNHSLLAALHWLRRTFLCQTADRYKHSNAPVSLWRTTSWPELACSHVGCLFFIHSLIYYPDGNSNRRYLCTDHSHLLGYDTLAEEGFNQMRITYISIKYTEPINQPAAVPLMRSGCVIGDSLVRCVYTEADGSRWETCSVFSNISINIDW